MSTSRNVELDLQPFVNKNREKDQASLDEYITLICLDRTVGDVILMRESSSNVKGYWGANLVFNAIFEQDINAINEIIKRVDGTVPDEKDRNEFANIVGDAIEDVMNYAPQNTQEFIEQVCTVHLTDPVVIGLAKVIIMLSMEQVGSNNQKRKDRQAAINIILNRTGGKKTEPTKQVALIEYVDPDWEKGLPSS